MLWSRSPYSASKAASDHAVRAYGETFGLKYIITNCSNNYGPYQFPEKLIPVVIKNCIDRNQYLFMDQETTLETGYTLKIMLMPFLKLLKKVILMKLI